MIRGVGIHIRGEVKLQPAVDYLGSMEESKVGRGCVSRPGLLIFPHQDRREEHELT